ncbi:MAG: 4Fe-4S binding protein [Deltaproteobacteria bacterium]|nr:4Fe-4S binding protein [Deltaproteobacteria bacterium]
MPKRQIVQIDEAKCDGCGQCVTACHEGAIAIVDGKARLVADTYCDGLGACIGDCPQSAITIVAREAEPFDARAVAERQAGPRRAPAGGCPGAAVRRLGPRPAPAAGPGERTGQASALANWPVQLHLAPIQAPYYHGARLLLAADCVPFALPEFHRRLLAGRTLLIGCPKLDDTSAYLEKLAAILRCNDVAAVEVAFMEVPCCHGLARLAAQAIRASGKQIPLALTKVGIGGEILEPAQRASA